MTNPNRVVAVIPCNDMEASIAFYGSLGFSSDETSSTPDYALLSDGNGGAIHLTLAPEGWLIKGRSPFGIYFYADDVDGLAARVKTPLLHPPRKQPWGMYEFALSDPDENLVRVGRAI